MFRDLGLVNFHIVELGPCITFYLANKKMKNAAWDGDGPDA